MKRYSLLDCTLRDGGYINDWNFGHSVITSIYKKLDVSGVEYIEVGFLDDRRKFDINRSIAPSTKAFDKIFFGIKKKHAIPVAMIDYGTCSLDAISECSTSFIDGIRVIFKKEKIEEALPFCQAIKRKGYKLFIQAISITSYSDIEILEYVKKINDIKPYAFSIVDTYGLLNNRKLSHYFDLIDNNLVAEVKVGYHAHNNFQLGFSNTERFFTLDTKRDLIADSTIYGMGKSAGNCPSELIAMHMNQQYEKHYDLSQFLEVFDADLMSIYQEHYWGYKYNFYISAMQNCHPNYVQYLLDKKTLTVSAVNEILSIIPKEKKLLYDKKYIEQAYTCYQNKIIDDTLEMAELSSELSQKIVLLIGPGHSIIAQVDKISEFKEKNKPKTIGINFVPYDYECDYIFMSNIKRYGKMVDRLCGTRLKSKLIMTSNVKPFDYQPDYRLNYGSLLYNGEVKSDNALLLCLNALVKMGVKNVYLAGFDGFGQGKKEYYDVSYSFAGNENYRIDSNKIIATGIKTFKEKLNISFLTNSLYERN